MDDAVQLFKCHKCGVEKPYTRAYFYNKDKKREKYDTICIDCRLEYDKRRRAQPEAKEKRRVRTLRTKARTDTYTERTVYKVVHDPDLEGGFPRGATIPQTHILEGMRMGCFTKNTIMRCGKRFFEILGGVPEYLHELSPSEVAAKVRV
jgi:hypothetical protein